MSYERLATELQLSLARQEELLRSSLVLNPVESFPFPADLGVISGHLHGLYNSDKERTRPERAAADIIFAGRRALEHDSRTIYRSWADALGAKDATLRLLSGLHAHIVLFMAIAHPGDSVLALPVNGGGHLSARNILERLGLEVIDMVVDESRMCVDMEQTLSLAERRAPDFIFIDRSEGLVVEDFKALTQLTACSIFDASQYLANILAGDHPNPFEDGFDLIIASLHKNFPGPQKALLATRVQDLRWQTLLRGISTYVSNMHVASTYAAGLALARSKWLTEYSRNILSFAVMLEDELASAGVPMVRRPVDKVPTHHLWLREGSRERAFATFESLEQCRILANFRKLPYGLGVGLRFGVSAAVQIGLEEADIPRLASLISEIRLRGPRNHCVVRGGDLTKTYGLGTTNALQPLSPGRRETASAFM